MDISQWPDVGLTKETRMRSPKKVSFQKPTWEFEMTQKMWTPKKQGVSQILSGW